METNIKFETKKFEIHFLNFILLYHSNARKINYHVSIML